MASVQKYRDGRWTAIWREPCPTGQLRANGSPVLVQRTKVIDAPSKAVAQTMATKIEADARLAGPQPAGKGTLAQFLYGVYLPHQRATKAAKTAHRASQLARAVVRILGDDLKLSDIKRGTFVTLVDRASSEVWPSGHEKAGERRYGPRTVHHLFAHLKAAMGFAYDEGHVKWNVRVEGVRAPKAPARGPNVKIASRDETMTLVHALRHGEGTRRNGHLADAIEFAFLTACRRQEVLGLHWSSASSTRRRPMS